MRGTVMSRLLSAVVVGALLLTGCSGALSGLNSAGNPGQESGPQPERPPLEVPAAFESEEQKQTFAIQAVRDGYYEEAAPLLEESVAQQPSADAYASLGTAQYNNKDYDGAIAAWSRAAELNPDLTGRMKNNIGNALRDSRRKAEAEQSYREALALEPTLWVAAINLATLLRLEDRLPEAIAVLEAAVENNPEVPPLVRLLESYQEAGQQ